MKKLYIIFILLISSSFILNAANFSIAKGQYITIPDWIFNPSNDKRALEIGREMYINNFEILVHNVPMHIARNNADLMQYLKDIYAYDDSTHITIVKRMVLIVNNDEHDFRDHNDTMVLIIVGTLKDRYSK